MTGRPAITAGPGTAFASAAAGLLAGALHLAPGAGARALRRVRVPGLDRLWLGQPADVWPGRVAAVYSLCGHAHRWTAVRAVQAARGEPHAPDAAAREALRWTTVREHARRLLLDWPAAWPLGEGHRSRALAALRAAPPDDGDTATREDRWDGWLACEVLQQPPAGWLKRAVSDGEPGLTAWAEATDTAVARWLAAVRPAARRPLVTGGVLSMAAEPDWLRAWADRLGTPQGAALAEAPAGPAGALETGPWARPGSAAAADAHNAWMRMTGRLVDLVRLARPGGAALLEHGQLDLGGGTGLAWTGMARGVLLHRVRLDGRGPGPDTVAACHVIAPTDWNTHPEGALARALAGLPADPSSLPAAQALALAFDPCVPVHWSAPAVSSPVPVGEAGRA